MTRALTYDQARILHTIRQLERSAEAPHTATELAYATHLRPATVRAALGSLARRGEVVRIGKASNGGWTWGTSSNLGGEL